MIKDKKATNGKRGGGIKRYIMCKRKKKKRERVWEH